MADSAKTNDWRGQFRDGLKWLRQAREYVSVPKEIQKQRYAQCQQCDAFDTLTKQCRECACFMPLKTRMNLTPCPRNKWTLI